jgi:CDP-Glycerol:Poly(glycerophosphate) glycerophosphotransferase
MTDPKVAFIVWNPFQVFQFQKLADAYPGSRYIVIDRGSNLNEFSAEFLRSSRPQAEIIKKNRILVIDGLYDVLFFQAPFPSIEGFKKTKLVSLQYGLAKERHNYGEWRALADMNLMYGPYSADFTSHFAPSYAVGNVKFADWDPQVAKKSRACAERELGLDASKKTILFMPTYGELGSFAELVAPLGAMAERYNVIVKMHHNNEKNGRSWVDVAKNHGLPHLMHGDADQPTLLSVSDLVVSDFSGAIFDAVYAKVPVLLYQPNASDVVGIQKFSLSSLEFRRRDEIGLVCERAEDFGDLVDRALTEHDRLVQLAAPIRAELFVDGSEHDIIALTKQKVRDLIEGNVPSLTFQQSFVRETCQNLRRAEVRLNKMKKKGTLQQLLETVRSFL